MARQPTLAAALGLAGDLWIKDETVNVSGSHKGRHLMGAMLYLRVLERSGLALGKALRGTAPGDCLLRQRWARRGGDRLRRRLAARRLHP